MTKPNGKPRHILTPGSKGDEIGKELACRECGRDEIVPNHSQLTNPWKGKVLVGRTRGLKQEAFILSYSEKGSIGSVCKELNLTPSTIYRWKDDDPIFAAKFADAKTLFLGRLEDAMTQRAIDGVEEPVVSAGRLVTTKRVFANDLLKVLAKANDPKKYGDGKSFGAEVGMDGDKRYLKVYEGFNPDDV